MMAIRLALRVQLILFLVDGNFCLRNLFPTGWEFLPPTRREKLFLAATQVVRVVRFVRRRPWGFIPTTLPSADLGIYSYRLCGPPRAQRA